MSGQLILLLKFYLQFFYIQWQIRENNFNSKLFPNFIIMDKCINDDDDDDDIVENDLFQRKSWIILPRPEMPGSIVYIIWQTHTMNMLWCSVWLLLR